MTRVAFLVNPASANGATRKRWPELEARARAAGLDGEVLFSERPGHLTELAAETAAELVVAVGGDGTVHEIANGIIRAGSNAELAVLPQGTGQDFIRSYAIPKDADGALAVARDGATRTIDAGLARYTGLDGGQAETYFANFAGAGISGAIAKRANESSKALGGTISFLWATVATFVPWKNVAVAVEIDGERQAGKLLECFVAIGEWAAGGMKVTPGAEPDDGLFDVLLIGDVNKADFLRTFPKIYRGRHVTHPKVQLLRGRTVTVEPERTLPLALDGEPLGTTPARFEIVPGALRLRVARS